MTTEYQICLEPLCTYLSTLRTPPDLKIADLHIGRDVDNTSCDVCQECLDEVRVHLDRHVHHI